VKNSEKQLQEHMNTAPIMAYWKSKGREAAPGMTIDWESMGWAMNESSVAKKWACKFAMGFFGHAKNMSRWKVCSTTSVHDVGPKWKIKSM